MPIRPTGLGRGLNSLIPSRKAAADLISDQKLQEAVITHDQVVQLPADKIYPNPHQPRQSFNSDALRELAESIKEHGVIQPIIVTKGDGENYELIAGERRLRAAKLAGLALLPAIIRDLNEQKRIEFALIENLQREDLNALEIALAYKKLEDEFNLSHEELAKKVGKSVSVIKNFLHILTLADEVQQAVLAGKLTEGHVRTLAGLPPAEQIISMEKMISGKMSVREAEKAARAIKAEKNFGRPRIFDPELKEMEEKIAANLGTKVDIRRHGGAGQITIKFFSNEELNSIVKKIS